MKSKRQVRDAVSRYVAQRLREIRIQRGMTVREAAARSGVADSSYRLPGERFYKIHLDNLFRILSALGAGIEQVWPRASRAPQGAVSSQYLEEAVRQSRERQLPGSNREAMDVLPGPDAELVRETVKAKRFEESKPQ